MPSSVGSQPSAAGSQTASQMARDELARLEDARRADGESQIGQVSSHGDSSAAPSFDYTLFEHEDIFL